MMDVLLYRLLIRATGQWRGIRVRHLIRSTSLDARMVH